MRRKFLSVLLAMAMVLTMVPVTALADGETVELTIAGTENRTALLTTDSVTISKAATASGSATDVTGATILWSTKTIGADVVTASGDVKEYENAIPYATLFPTNGSDTSVTVYAVAVKDDAQVSVPANKAFTKAGTVATPTFKPEAGAVESGATVEIECTTNDAEIYYVTDADTELTAENAKTNGTKYTQAIEITSTTTIKAIALLDGSNPSDVASATYTIKATTPPEDNKVNAVTVTLTAPAKKGTPQATIAAVDGQHSGGAVTWKDEENNAPTKFLGGKTYTASVTLDPPTDKAWAEAVTVTLKSTGGTAQTAKVEGGKLKFDVKYSALDAAALTKIEVTTQPTKKAYNVGEDFNIGGMVVTGTYDDDSTKVLEKDTDYTLSGNATDLTEAVKTITITAKANTKLTATVAVTVTKKSITLKASGFPTIGSATVTYGDAKLPNLVTTDAKVVDNADATVTITGTWDWKAGEKPTVAGDNKTFKAVFTPASAESAKYTFTNSPLEVDITVNVVKAKLTAGAYSVENQSMKKDAAALDKIVKPEKASGVGGEPVEGTVNWYKEAQCTTTAEDTQLSGAAENAEVELYWKFTPTNTNYDETQPLTGGPVTITVVTDDVVLVEFPQKAASVVYGDEATVAAKVYLNGNASADYNITYESSDATAATVAANGKVKGLKASNTPVTITAKAMGGEPAEEKATATYKLTVTKRPITITADDKSMDQNGTLPTFTASLTSGTLATGDTCTYSATCGVDGKTAGIFDIVPTATFDPAAKADNYEITKVNGTLTVTAKDDPVTPPDPDTPPTPPVVTDLSVSPSSVDIPSGGVGTTFSMNAAISGGTEPYTPTKSEGAPEWVSVSVDGSTLVISVARPSTVTSNIDPFVITLSDSNGRSVTVPVTVGNVIYTGGGGGGGSHGGGGSSSSSSATTTEKVPVSGDEHSVEVSARVSGTTATISKIDGIDRVLDTEADTGVVEIDLTKLNKSIDTVSLPAADMREIAAATADNDNDADGLAIKLDSGTVEFDADALAAIADQATGSTIQLKLEETSAGTLNSVQRSAVRDMEVHGHFDLTLTGGRTITDFDGGRVTVRIPFSVPSGKIASNFVVLYVADNGTVEEMRTSCSGGYLVFTTGHFSKYLIVYKASEADNTPSATDANCPAGRFTDVNTDLWYHNAIDYVLTNGLMSGVGDNAFAPNANLSRAMLAQILYNQEGKPAVSAGSAFDDVAAGMWYTNAIAWAAEDGVVSGLGGGKFGPNNNITREQLAVMLYRYAGSPSAAGGGSLDRFADADKASGYAKDALVWATGMGIMSGKGGGMLDPQGQATRAEVAQMLYNYLNI